MANWDLTLMDLQHTLDSLIRRGYIRRTTGNRMLRTNQTPILMDSNTSTIPQQNLQLDDSLDETMNADLGQNSTGVDTEAGNERADNSGQNLVSRRDEISPQNQERRKNIFISYRWQNAANLANVLYDNLKSIHNVFLDSSMPKYGKPIPETILCALSKADVFLVILSQNCLRECRGHGMCNDLYHLEIFKALNNPNVRIFPILTEDYKTPDNSPNHICDITKIQGLTYHPDMKEACLNIIKQFITE